MGAAPWIVKTIELANVKNINTDKDVKEKSSCQES